MCRLLTQFYTIHTRFGQKWKAFTERKCAAAAERHNNILTSKWVNKCIYRLLFLNMVFCQFLMSCKQRIFGAGSSLFSVRSSCWCRANNVGTAGFDPQQVLSNLYVCTCVSLSMLQPCVHKCVCFPTLWVYVTLSHGPLDNPARWWGYPNGSSGPACC